MTVVVRRFFLLCSVCISWSAQASLFSSDETLNVTIEADFKQLESERDKQASYPGTLSINETELPIALEVRGNFRLKKDTCQHAPLRVDFRKSEARKASVFEKQDDIKLVVLCRDRKTYHAYLRKEYLVYQLLAEVTEASYRVRWAEITYLQSGGGKAKVRPGFFVEKKNTLPKETTSKPTKK